MSGRILLFLLIIASVAVRQKGCGKKKNADIERPQLVSETIEKYLMDMPQDRKSNSTLLISKRYMNEVNIMSPDMDKPYELVQTDSFAANGTLIYTIFENGSSIDSVTWKYDPLTTQLTGFQSFNEGMPVDELKLGYAVDGKLRRYIMTQGEKKTAWNYIYDKVGRISQRYPSDDSPTPDYKREHYKYDPFFRLTEATVFLETVALSKRAFKYDGFGRLSGIDFFQNGELMEARTFAYNEENLLLIRRDKITDFEGNSKQRTYEFKYEYYENLLEEDKVE